MMEGAREQARMLDRVRFRGRALADRIGLGKTRPEAIEVHLDAAMRWLCRAQDVAKKGTVRDDGVSQTYHVRTQVWAPSYPETTGYIIPTFYRYWRFSGDEGYRKRAARMADWECEIQHPSGGVLAGALGDSDQPTIFNTGQVLFGWVTAFEEEGKETYRDSAVRAANWLCRNQDEDGCWRKFGSPLTNSAINLYNTRTAWGLSRVNEITGEKAFLVAAQKNVEWAIAQQLPNGWFPRNCLTDESQPFVHTIAYAMRGILEVGVSVECDRYISSAVKVGDAMVQAMPADGELPGRFDSNWRPTVNWSCLTGVAQMAVNLGRLYQMTGRGDLISAMKKATRFVMTTQKLRGDSNELGGIKGSHPINGSYHPWQYPNWSGKFFADALMLQHEITERSHSD
jgi:hypothetical protein